MYAKRLLITAIIVLLFLALKPYTMQLPPETTTVEAGLFAQETQTLSILVTAGDVDAAVRAIEALGGQVVSGADGGDTLSARLPAAQLDALVIAPGIRAIAADHGVAAAGN